MNPERLAQVIRATHGSLHYAMLHADSMHLYQMERGFPVSAQLFADALWILTSNAEAFE